LRVEATVETGTVSVKLPSDALMPVLVLDGTDVPGLREHLHVGQEQLLGGSAPMNLAFAGLGASASKISTTPRRYFFMGKSFEKMLFHGEAL